MGGPFPGGGPGNGRCLRWESAEPRCSVPSDRIICFSEAVGFGWVFGLAGGLRGGRRGSGGELLGGGGRSGVGKEREEKKELASIDEAKRGRESIQMEVCVCDSSAAR